MPLAMRRPLLWALCLLPLLSVFAESTQAADSSVPAADVTARFLQAAQKFEEARAGSAAAVAPAQAAFKSLLDSEPSNPLFMAYYGSTFGLQARDGGAPWQRLKLVREAIAQIDRALSLLGPQDDARQIRGVPLSLETRFVAIATYVPMPSMFNRRSVAREQLATAMASPLFATASTELRGRFYYEEALIARADGDTARERRSLQQVVKYAPPSLNMKEVRDELAKLGG